MAARLAIQIPTTRPANIARRASLKHRKAVVTRVTPEFDVTGVLSGEWPATWSLVSWGDVQEHFMRTVMGQTSTPTMIDMGPPISDGYEFDAAISREWPLASFEEPVSELKHSLEDGHHNKQA